MDIKIIFTIALLVLGFDLSAQQENKKNVVVLTDIEADPDDTQSLIRFLCYANQWNVEGLIATTSIHQKTMVAPESILEVLAGFEKVRDNLEKHEKGFPASEEL